MIGCKRDKKRIKRILKLIEKNWLEIPDQRLGQFLINYVYRKNYTDIFYQEDDITEDNLLSIKKEKV